MHIAAPGTNILSTIAREHLRVFTGTSMAAPHVTGVAALLKAQDPARDWRAIKNLILAGAEGDLYPDNDELITEQAAERPRLARVREHRRCCPACGRSATSSTAVAGRPMELSALNIRCAAPNGNVTVTVEPGRPDRHAAGRRCRDRSGGRRRHRTPDSGRPPRQGLHPHLPRRRRRDRAGADRPLHRRRRCRSRIARSPERSITILPGEPGEIASPFPLRFAGGSFTTLFVDERGAVQFDGGGFRATSRPSASRCPRRTTRR